MHCTEIGSLMQGLIVALLEIKCDADPSVLSASAAQEAICWLCHQTDVERLEHPGQLALAGPTI